MDKKGNTITGHNKVMGRWKQYVQDMIEEVDIHENVTET